MTIPKITPALHPSGLQHAFLNGPICRLRKPSGILLCAGQ